jgi:hypothetical protein
MSHDTTVLRQAAPATLVGMACVVAGGLVAAFTAASPTEHGAWAAAYLVLVAGVSQVGLAVGQSVLTARSLPARTSRAELVTWNGGNAAVLTGTLAGIAWVVDVGGALLVATLALVASGVRRHPVRDGSRRQALARKAFQLLVLVLLLSIPIGLWLARQSGA